MNRSATTSTLAQRRLVSLKTVAEMVDAHRSTVRRWLAEADISPVSIGRGRCGAIRYRWRDIETWIQTLDDVE